jgi:hypothetical protein
MTYYEIRAAIKDDEGKIAIKQFVAKAESIILADAIVSTNTDCERTTGINEKNWINVFDDEDKSAFYEIKVEIESLDGKNIAELFLQKADSTHDAEVQLLLNIDYKPEFKVVKETKIVASY